MYRSTIRSPTSTIRLRGRCSTNSISRLDMRGIVLPSLRRAAPRKKPGFSYPAPQIRALSRRFIACYHWLPFNGWHAACVLRGVMGTQFHLRLARSDEMASVLIVDDDTDGRAIVESYLTKAGHSVRTVANGRAALIALAASVPDVVILDIMM